MLPPSHHPQLWLKALETSSAVTFELSLRRYSQRGIRKRRSGLGERHLHRLFVAALLLQALQLFFVRLFFLNLSIEEVHLTSRHVSGECEMGCVRWRYGGAVNPV